MGNVSTNGKRMNEKYSYNIDGVIEQVDKTPIEYNESYISNSYDEYGEKVNYMSYLRLGYIIGCYGDIPRSIMDIGYGNGSFLNAASDIVHDCYGYDITNYPLPEKDNIYYTDILPLEVDIVTLFDSLEHFENIDEVIQSLNCKAICISVPFCHATTFDDPWFDGWKHRRPGEHFWHFNINSLCNFMTRNGFEVTDYCNIEDTIRKGPDIPNILTGFFKAI